MSLPSDYSSRMPVPDQIDDAAAETLLTGGDPSADLEPVATALRAMREAADRPVRPRADLAEQMAAGVFTATPERYPGPALGPQGRGLGAAVRRAVRTCPHVLAAVPRRVASLSLAAKLAAGVLAIGLFGVGSAGVAGVLPAPVQDGFRTVVETVTPYEFPGNTTPEGDPMGRTGSETEPEQSLDIEPTPHPPRSESSRRPTDPGKPSDDPPTTPVPGAGQPGEPANPDPPGNQPDLPDNPGQGNPGQGNPGQGNPGQGNPGQGNPGQGNPGQGNPGRGNPDTE